MNPWVNHHFKKKGVVFFDFNILVRRISIENDQK